MSKNKKKKFPKSNNLVDIGAMARHYNFVLP